MAGFGSVPFSELGWYIVDEKRRRRRRQKTEERRRTVLKLKSADDYVGRPKKQESGIRF